MGQRSLIVDVGRKRLRWGKKWGKKPHGFQPISTDLDRPETA
jgi:hypothetical protein